MSYFLLLLSVYSIPLGFVIWGFTGDWYWALLPLGIFILNFVLGIIRITIELQLEKINTTKQSRSNQE